MSNLNGEVLNKSNGQISEFKNKQSQPDRQMDRMAHSTGESLGSMASDFASTTAESMKTGREYVRENPIKGVAMAVAAGAVVGGLFATVMRRQRN